VPGVNCLGVVFFFNIFSEFPTFFRAFCFVLTILCLFFSGTICAMPDFNSKKTIYSFPL